MPIRCTQYILKKEYHYLIPKLLERLPLVLHRTDTDVELMVISPTSATKYIQYDFNVSSNNPIDKYHCFGHNRLDKWDFLPPLQGYFGDETLQKFIDYPEFECRLFHHLFRIGEGDELGEDTDKFYTREFEMSDADYIDALKGPMPL